MNKIKILFCLETIGWGGVENRRFSLIKSLDLSKYEIKIVCTKAIGLYKSKFESLGIEIFQVGEFKNTFELKKLFYVRTIIKRFKPAIIHGGVFEGNTMAIVSSLFIPGIKVIIEETSDPKNRNFPAHLLLRFYSFFAIKFVAISPSVEDYLINKLKIDSSKVVLINNAVPNPRKVSSIEIKSLKTNLGISDSDFVIGSVGRLRDFHKRFSDIIKAVALIPYNQNIKILIVGDGPDKRNLEELAKNLGMNENMIFVGLQMDTSPYYKLMDIFCLASFMEGFGLVIVEAMYHKLAVIGSKVGGIVDIIDHNKTGFLVDSQNPQQIANQIIRLLENEELRFIMGYNGFQKASMKYAVERYTDEVKALYNGILGY
ncbi:glycosyltransferase family 4 protein [Cyclobacterium marinum]|uniref:glycosyltransferase family 4 protein n=1 Tax=Cyclobacterium marinum TaxID=104 RepID=UPI0011ECCA1F|nr:glycosyltransferase family 4 protein [Cyclobacterium marinum]MBI0397198.1 glycosyltransferase family 4 protein [Cyclobacterium marinum]